MVSNFKVQVDWRLLAPRHPTNKCLVAQSCKTEHDVILQQRVWCWLHTFITTTMITCGGLAGLKVARSYNQFTNGLLSSQLVLATQCPVSSCPVQKELCPRINEEKNCRSISGSCYFLHSVPEATGVEVEDVDNSVMKTIMAIKIVFIFPSR